MKVKIKNFGKDESFNSFKETQEALAARYRGMHVSIVFAGRSNLLRTLFVSVDSQGNIYESYGNQAKIEFSKLV